MDMDKNDVSIDLSRSIQEDNIEQVRYILHKQHDNVSRCINEMVIDGLTPLMLAAKHNNVEIAQILMRHR